MELRSLEVKKLRSFDISFFELPSPYYHPHMILNTIKAVAPAVL